MTKTWQIYIIYLNATIYRHIYHSREFAHSLVLKPFAIAAGVNKHDTNTNSVRKDVHQQLQGPSAHVRASRNLWAKLLELLRLLPVLLLLFGFVLIAV